MSRPARAIVDALSFAFGMDWEVLWVLIVGFPRSGAVRAVVSKREMRRLLPDSLLRSLAIATALAATAFPIASTNLVVEPGIIMALALGWQFTAVEFGGGPMIVICATVLLRRLVRPHIREAARRQAERGVRGSTEAHATISSG